MLKEKLEKRQSTEHITLLVGMAFPRAGTKETAKNRSGINELWPADRNVLTHADFVYSYVIHFTHAIKRVTPK
jgi:hypothetical protein